METDSLIAGLVVVGVMVFFFWILNVTEDKPPCNQRIRARKNKEKLKEINK